MDLASVENLFSSIKYNFIPLPDSKSSFKAFEKLYFDVLNRSYELLRLSPEEIPIEEFVNSYDFQDYFKRAFIATAINGMARDWKTTGKGKRYLAKEFIPSLSDTYVAIPDRRLNALVAISSWISKKIEPKIEEIFTLQADTELEDKIEELRVKTENTLIKLEEKLIDIRNDILKIDTDIRDNKAMPKRDRLKIQVLEENRKNKKELEKEIEKKINKIRGELKLTEQEQKRLKDRIDLKEKQEKEKRTRILETDYKRKAKIMSKESNKVVEELQKIISDFAARGIPYEGSGMKKKKKVRMVKPKGGKYEDPLEEISYLLKRLAELLDEGDLEHLDIIAKKLRKVKKIGRGKYYIKEIDDDFEGGKMKKKKKVKGGRVMSAKQQAWMDLIDKVQSKNPKLTRKECMSIASEKRKKMSIKE